MIIIVGGDILVDDNGVFWQVSGYINDTLCVMFMLADRNLDSNERRKQKIEHKVLQEKLADGSLKRFDW